MDQESSIFANTDPTYQVSQLPLIQGAHCQGPGVKEMVVQDTFCLKFNARICMQI